MPKAKTEFVYPPKIQNITKKQTAQMLWCLALDGPFEDQQSGLAARAFKKALNARGVYIKDAAFNRILLGLSNLDDYFVYNYIERVMSGKRTYRISLEVDPDKVPFPESPFKPVSTFTPANAVPLAETNGETYARQGVFEGETEPEEEAVDEVVDTAEAEELPEAETVDTSPEDGDTIDPGVTLEPYEPPAAVNRNGDQIADDTAIDLGQLTSLSDLLAGTEATTVGSLIAKAMSVLSDAIALDTRQQAAGTDESIMRRIDQRFGAYVLMQDDLERERAITARLKHMHEELVGLVKQRDRLILAQQAKIAELERQRAGTP